MKTDTDKTQTPSATAEKSAHTPTDWYLGDANKDGARCLIVAGHSVGHIFTTNKGVTNLIAAAPELLAALKEIRDILPRKIFVTGFQNRILNITGAAIAKAEGGAQ